MEDNLSTTENSRLNRAKKFWSTHDQKILTITALILVALVSFRAGQTQEKNNSLGKINVQLNQLTTANPAQEKIKTLGETLERKGIEISSSKENSSEEKECAFIGSKNSDKYHLPSCQWATRISEANRICFSSKEVAEKEGYQPAKCCIK